MNAGIGIANNGAMTRCRSAGQMGLLMNELHSISARTRSSAATRTPIGPENDSAITTQRSVSFSRARCSRTSIEASLVG